MVQGKGAHRSFHPSTRVAMAALRSVTLRKVPRRIACRVMIPEKIDLNHVHQEQSQTAPD